MSDALPHTNPFTLAHTGPFTLSLAKRSAGLRQAQSERVVEGEAGQAPPEPSIEASPHPNPFTLPHPDPFTLPYPNPFTLSLSKRSAGLRQAQSERVVEGEAGQAPPEPSIEVSPHPNPFTLPHTDPFTLPHPDPFTLSLSKRSAELRQAQTKRVVESKRSASLPQAQFERLLIDCYRPRLDPEVPHDRPQSPRIALARWLAGQNARRL
ncbi:MAG: hypothetical protein ACK5OA_12965 [Acidovorax sp.]